MPSPFLPHPLPGGRDPRVYNRKMHNWKES